MGYEKHQASLTKQRRYDYIEQEGKRKKTTIEPYKIPTPPKKSVEMTLDKAIGIMKQPLLDWEELAKALAVIIEAASFQIPTKMIETGDSTELYECPRCKKRSYRKVEMCHRCGQKFEE